MKNATPWLLGLLVGALLAGCGKGDPQAEARLELLTKRVEALEAEQKKLVEVGDFVRPIMEQQKQAADQQAASEPDPNARFAVTVAGNAYEGPEGAAVTIIEAFDFA